MSLDVIQGREDEIPLPMLEQADFRSGHVAVNALMSEIFTVGEILIFWWGYELSLYAQAIAVT